MNPDTQPQQEPGLHWHILHCGDGVCLGRCGIFRNCRWTCNNSDRAEKGRRRIRFRCWTIGLLHRSESHVSRGNVLLFSHGRHKSVLPIEKEEGHKRVIVALEPSEY